MSNMTELVIIVLLAHWVADFILQTDWQAKNKSINNKALLSHVATYSGLMFIVALALFLDVQKAFIFWLVTFGAHGLTDYCTSRIVKKYYEKGDTHNMFVVIGFDQILHYLQLYSTFLLLL